MRNLKKFLALVLAMMMAFSLMATANAANPKTDYPDMDSVLPEFEEAVDVLSGMGVFRGNNGQFLPQNKIMRCEAVAILYRLVTGDVEDVQAKLYAPLATYFNDVKADDWFAPYVGFAVDAGYVKGYNGSFNPYSNVTGYEMLAMLLRAVGYGKNGEFTGSQWQINVGSTAQGLGILKDIESTHYAHTLSQPSAREVVADLTFRVAADVHQVRYEYGYYNPYIGVANAQGGNYYNPTLGWKVFGLDYIESIIVGNQATSEKGTRLGVSATTTTTGGNIVKDEYGYDVVVKFKTGSTTEVEQIIYRFDNAGKITTDYTGAFETDGSLKAGYGYLRAPSSTNQTGYVDLSYNYSSDNVLFDFKTGLNQFAHQVKVWYDWRVQNGDGAYKTYALLDHVKSDKAFFADDNTKVGDTDGTGVTGAKKDTVLWSDRFSQIEPVAFNATTNLSPISTYRKVVNPSGTVYIALSAEVADVAQKNSTTAKPYLILGSSITNESTFGNGAKGTILLSQLTPDTKEEQQKPGETVTAWQIVGTSFTLAEANTVDATAAHNADTNRSGAIMYQLDPMTTKTITVSSLKYTTDPASIDGKSDPVIKVFTTAGDELDLSGITLGNRTSGGATSEIISQALPIVIKTASASGASNIALKANITYTAYMDIVGRFISMVPANDYKFLYSTYAGYDLDGYDAGTIKYNIVGVDWDAKIQAQNTLKTLTLNITTGVDDPATYITSIDDAAGVTVPINGAAYDKIATTKKDQGNVNSGNEIQDGVDTGYMFNATTGDLAASTHRKMIDDDVWNITAQDAVNGFKKVSINQGATAVEYLLTKDTHFIIVSGTGTATLKVTEANGLTALLDGATSAQIVYDTSEDIDNEVIFRTEADKYGTMYTDDNGVITDVILSVDNLIRWNTQTLYFDYDQEAGGTGMVLPGTDPTVVQQFELWQNGQKVTAYIDVTLGNGSDLAISSTNYFFFTLAQAYEVNGTPVYMAVKAPAAGGETAGVGGLGGSGFSARTTTYDYVTVTNLHTGLFKDTTPDPETTLVLNMDNVTVCDVQWKTDPAVRAARSEITSVLELNNAVSVGKQALASGALDPNYTVNVAVVYNNSNASAVTVYVVDLANA